MIAAHMRVAITLLCLVVVSAGSGWAFDLYLLRHAETMGNVTGQYTEENQRTFSPRGLEQIERLADKLAELRFDCVLVSPAWRVQKTILPYLKKTGQRAEICAEVEEVDCGIRGDEPAEGEPPRGEPIVIVPEGEDVFFVPEGAAGRRYAPRHKGDGLAILRRAVELLRSRFGGRDVRVLIVTHSCTGGRLLEMLLGLPAEGALNLDNAALSHVREREDGSFELLVYNDEVLTPLRRCVLLGFDPTVLPRFVNLSGPWKVAAGDNPAWADPGADESSFLAVRVPGGWERSALPGYDGFAWYRTHFRLSEAQREAWLEEPLVLLIGAIDDADETYLNGQRIGASGRFSPQRETAWDRMRLYSVPREVLRDENVLAIRVEDWGGGGGIWRGPVALGPAGVLPQADRP